MQGAHAADVCPACFACAANWCACVPCILLSAQVIAPCSDAHAHKQMTVALPAEAQVVCLCRRVQGLVCTHLQPLHVFLPGAIPKKRHDHIVVCQVHLRPIGSKQ